MVIEAAKEDGALFEDFEKEMVWYIYQNFKAPGMLQTHIEKQVAKAKQMW
ncbi:hypothetical protein M988_4284 [Hafnia paralvei ATCC 29927]|nr:hypothetical protein M988_4284 [Hafnia paralvei ATCC 29927]